MTILDELAESRRQDLEDIREIIKSLSPEIIGEKKEKRSPLSTSLKNLHQIGIISELKPGSPSKGVLIKTKVEKDKNINVMDVTIDEVDKIITAMIEGGVVGISVLTEPRRFFGSFGNLQAVSKITPNNIPILLKDFVIDEAQIKLGKRCGASNALLIASICDPLKTAQMMVENGLEPLVEIHDQNDLQRIEPLKNSRLSFVIGINNRNLKDLSTSFNPTYDLVPKIREMFGNDQIIITESGIDSRGDIVELGRLEVKAALVGTTIMQGFIKKKIKELLGLIPPFVKICGISSKDTFKHINKVTISAFGSILDVPSSPRNISVNSAIKLFRKSNLNLLRTVVTKNKDTKQIIDLYKNIRPDLIQTNFNNPVGEIKDLPAEIISKLLVSIRGKKLGEKNSIELINSLPKSIFGVVLDSSEGSGSLIDAKLAKNITKLCADYRIIIAGGINPKNVFKLYDEIRPFGIDVSSGLESEPGIKDSNKIREFISEIDRISESNI